ncbi:MAG TPA: DUF885 domain-containing protein [Vicinamibacterales bacterium]|nr:DUF885 domain-containing protein [Vicinamibacterales bacterium]
MGRVVFAVALAAAVLVASGAPRAQGTERFSGPSSQSLLQLFDEYWEWKIARRPELATSAGRREHNARWTDRSKAARDKDLYDLREWLQRGMWFSPGTLTPSMRLTAYLLESDARDQIESEPYLSAISLVSQMTGVQNTVFQVVDQMPVATVEDYENIVARLRALPQYVDQTIGQIQENANAGLTQPAVVVDLVLEQLAAQRRAAPFDSPLLAAFLRFPDAIPATAQRRLRADAAAAYTQAFVPAWTRLETYLRDSYRPRARTQPGLSAWQDGQTAYARLIKHYTTMSAVPQEVHQLGLREVDRIEREMQAIARDYGFTGTLQAFEQELANRPGMKFESQDEMLAYASDVLSALEPTMSRLFLHVPRAKVGVRPIPPDREASQASSYVAGTADGSRQAWFNMNTYRPRNQVKYTVEALVLHETIPGHHLQVGLARELEGVPQFQRAFNASAFAEGWGLYAESLGTTLGVVYRDPPTRFGRLASERFRAVRLVVDTGLHAMGWSRERAREYFTAHAPSQSLAEVDRYIAMPAQALGYKLGQLKILELRDRAQKALGSRFDLRVFHDVVLRNGTIPLDLLEDEVDRYIAEARKAE